MHIQTKAGTRIDLAGGTLDIWPISQVIDHPYCVNLAISLYAQSDIHTVANTELIELSSLDRSESWQGKFSELSKCQNLPLLAKIVENLWTRELGGLKLTTSALSPAGAGLGGSSVLAVTIAKGLSELKAKLSPVPALSDGDIVSLVRDIEARIIHTPTGEQDYWAGILGGLNVYDFSAGGVKHKSLKNEGIDSLFQQLLFFDSGQSRASAVNNWHVFRAVFDGNLELIKSLEGIGKLAFRVAQALEKGNIGEALALSSEEWQLRKNLWPGIETDATRTVDTVAKKNGAIFSRVGGAGGGGVVAVVADQKHHSSIIKACSEVGIRHLPAAAWNEPVQYSFM